MDLNWIGSFQNENNLYSSEHPIEEVWSQIGRFGTSSFLESCKPDKQDIPWDEYLKYARVRIRQSIEFREASQSSTLLTSPLPLYYSFLNLTRAFLALGPELMPRSGHGLKFIKADDLLDSKAQLSKGTFTDYLDASSIGWQEGCDITLGGALGHIVELAHDYRSFSPNRGYVQPVWVRAQMKGSVRLQFLDYPKNFAQDWQNDFSELVDVCVYEKDSTLLVTDPQVGQEYSNVSQFLAVKLMPGLTLQNHSTWYMFRKDNLPIKLNRAGYYYVAMFILGSVVRYEPELMLSVSSDESETGWLLRRFLKHAERFFPQLKLTEFYKREIYFSGSVT